MGTLSMTGRSTKSRLGGRDPLSCDRPSPHAGEFLLKLGGGPSRLTGRSKLRAGGPVGTVGVSGPLRSQLPKSRIFPSLGSYPRRPPRSLPASETASKPPPVGPHLGSPEPKPPPIPPRSEKLRLPCCCGGSGYGPFLDQSLKSLVS